MLGLEQCMQGGETQEEKRNELTEQNKPLKVRQPVICANNHVFCSVCIELWLKNNSQCPACRVPITQENPCKSIIGGTSEDEGTQTYIGRKHLRKTRLELLQKEYEEEIESLLKETEDLKRANLRLEERFREANDPAAISMSCDCGNKEAEDRKGIRLLEEWSRKLEMVNAANKKVVEDIAKLKEENRKLRNENLECVRENLRLKNEVDLRSPQKFGRFTVAALQAKADQYEREMSRIKKALERSDRYIEELEAQVEQLKRPPENIQKEKSQCENAAHVRVTDAATTHACQEMNATQQFLCHNHKTGVCSEESNGKNAGIPEIKKTTSKYPSTLLYSSKPMSLESVCQREGAELAQGFGSPTSSLSFSSLHLNTPGSKANCSSSHGHLKKPLTYLRKLVFDDLPKRKELCKSNSSNGENNLNSVGGFSCFCEPKLSIRQTTCEPGESKLPEKNDIGLQLEKQTDNTIDQREHPEGLNQSRVSVGNSMDKGGSLDNVNELNTVTCNGRSQVSYCGIAPSGTKMNFLSDSFFKVGKDSGESASSRQCGERIASVSYAPCCSSAVGVGEHSQYNMNQPAAAIQDKNFQGHLSHTDSLSCEPSLQSKKELIFHSAFGEAECTGHTSQSTRMSHCILQAYSNSPPAKRKMLNQSSDSPSKSSKI
ncbi:ORC ubiquitin ligase 1 isoform X2 [Rhinoderma darwinii]|uniref:ORC ubiquitin ligase 1 isoform X2 n=1 Tax=Rhinoderma darwinii TaxID=43563 RepID=UPI003F6779E8